MNVIRNLPFLATDRGLEAKSPERVTQKESGVSMRYFTHYWSSKRIKKKKFMQERKGKPLVRTAGKRFHSRNVKRGDFIYVVTAKEGIMYLIARMQVGDIVTKAEAESRFPEDVVWDAEEQVIAFEGTSTAQTFDRSVPTKLVRQLRFVLASGDRTPLVMYKNGLLDKQTLRNVRELSEESAKLLETIIHDTEKDAIDLGRRL